MRRWACWLCLLLAGGAAAQAPSWFDAGRPSVQAQQAVALLADAASHGLDARDYDAAALQLALDQAQQGVSAAAAEALAQALTLAMQRYLGDLHLGRIDPRRIHHDFDIARREPFDAARLLQQMTPDAAARAAAPQIPLYQHLRVQLARLRALGDDPAWGQPLPALPAAGRGAAKLEPGRDWSGVPRLADRLLALGDLQRAAVPPPRYEGALVDGRSS